ncbi:MAG: hypothetical protein IPM83_12280 [Ignavibacteria bacterium]|nr:hypothetical protein [Ignavibacteria bacterium]
MISRILLSLLVTVVCSLPVWAQEHNAQELRVTQPTNGQSFVLLPSGFHRATDDYFPHGPLHCGFRLGSAFCVWQYSDHRLGSTMGPTGIIVLGEENS